MQFITSMTMTVSMLLILLVFAMVQEGAPFQMRAPKIFRPTQSPASKLNMQQTQTGQVFLSSLAATGAVETGYLTLQRLTASPISSVLCSSGSELDSCNSVISGPFSVIPIVNFPLSGVAFIVYTSIAVLSLLSMQKSTEGQAAGQDADNASILFLTTTMATFSAYLVFLLRYVLQTSCNYCYLSAGISFALATVAWSNSIVPNKTRALVVTVSSMAITTLTSAFLFYTTSALSLGIPLAQASTAPAAQFLETEAAASKQPKEAPGPPPVTDTSSPEALALAVRLEKLDAKMYGAYWCSHCFNQKQVLGLEAKSRFSYIECDKEGKNSQYDTCKSKKVPGYPTWEIEGKFYPGEKSVNELSALLTKIEAEGAGVPAR